MLTKNRSKIILLATLALAINACDYELQGSEEEETAFAEPEEPKQIKAIIYETGVIKIEPTVTANSLTLSVTGIPDGATLECHLNQMPLVPCTDNAAFLRPSAGTYKITAAALEGDRIVALGESKSFEIIDEDEIDDEEFDLQLVSTVADFELYQPHDLTTPFVATFDFAETPACETTVKCAFGSPQTQFWGKCDAGDTSFTVTPEMLALDAQTVKVRAQCGDTIGPALHFPINGVPTNYEPLQLFERIDTDGRHLFELINRSDCTADSDNYRFECRIPGSEYERCENPQTNPRSGTEIRMICADVVGPALTIE